MIEIRPNVTQRVREGDNITVNCTTRDSLVLGWGSPEYIDDGGRRLEFSAEDDPIGTIRTSDKEPTTFANLTRLSVNETVATFIIESQLHITVLANYSQFSVTCHNPGNSLVERLTFNVGKILLFLE